MAIFVLAFHPEMRFEADAEEIALLMGMECSFDLDHAHFRPD
ncbi:hypothetical protein [Ensifer canadensis]